jgi:hemerythrin-like domain-containing protein
MDAIQIILKDHREVEALFKSFEKAAREGRDRQQARLARDLVRELSMHAAIEEQLVYPALRRAGVEEEVLGALEEHHATKVMLSEIEALGPGAERFVAKVAVLATAVRHHVAEEERQLLPRLRRELDRDALRQLGDALVEAKRAAPTRPHPQAPDTPPANFIANAGAALVDRARDALRDAFGTLRTIFDRAGRQGADVGRFVADRAGARGREMVGQAAARGREVIRESRERSGRTIDGAGRRGEAASRKVRKAGRQVARGQVTKATPREESRATVH